MVFLRERSSGHYQGFALAPGLIGGILVFVAIVIASVRSRAAWSRSTGEVFGEREEERVGDSFTTSCSFLLNRGQSANLVFHLLTYSGLLVSGAWEPYTVKRRP